MQVSVESITDLERRLTVELPKEVLVQQIDERLTKLKDQVHIDGFRAGKVPMDVVRSKYGMQVEQEVFSEAINDSLQKALSQEQLNPVGKPVVELDESSVDTILRYFATFEVIPQIDLPPVEQIKIERPTVKIQESDIDNLIETLRKQRMLWKPVTRPAALGDKVIVNYNGEIDGEGFVGGLADGLAVVIGEGSLIPGFEEQLIGMEVDVSAKVSVSISDSYPVIEHRGKSAVFEVKILHIDEPELPELDDMLARSFGVTDGGVSAFRDRVSQNMEVELKQKIFERVRGNMIEQLLEILTVLPPESMVVSELERMKHIATENQIDLGVDEVELLSQAKRRVSTGLVLVEMAKNLGITPTSELIREKIESLAESYENPEEVVAWYYSSQEQLASVNSIVTEELLVEHVLEHGQVTDKPLLFSEIMVGSG